MDIIIRNILDDKLRKDFQMTIPNQIISNKIDDYIANNKSEITINGFNKGDAPVNIIKERLGKSLMAEQTDILISETLSKIVNDNSYKIASKPKIDFKTFEENKDVDLVASFEIFPSMPNIDLSNIKLNTYKTQITDLDIDEAVKKTLRSAMNWVKQEPNYQAKNGDIVIINYSGKIDGKSFDGSDGKDFRLELGTKTFIDNFEDQLIGKTTGAKVSVSVNFPNDYFRPALSNLRATFEVEITSILKADEANFDDNFIKKATGLENLEKLKEAIFNRISFDYQNTCRAIFKKELFDFLDANYSVEIPAGILSEQINFLKQVNSQNNPNAKNNDSEKELKLSQRMVRCGLILADIADKNSIGVSQEEVDNEINNIVNLYPNQREQVVENYNKNPQAMQQLIGAILEEKAVNFILTKIQINEVPVTTKQVDRMWFDISNI